MVLFSNACCLTVGLTVQLFSHFALEESEAQRGYVTSPTSSPANTQEMQDPTPGLADSTTRASNIVLPTLLPLFHVLSPIQMTMIASQLVINFLLLTEAIVSEISAAPSGILIKM